MKESQIKRFSGTEEHLYRQFPVKGNGQRPCPALNAPPVLDFLWEIDYSFSKDLINIETTARSGRFQDGCRPAASGERKHMTRIDQGLETGITFTMEDRVTEANAARTLGSGSLMVYGTPAMLLLVEKTAVALLEDRLEPGFTSVGTKLNMDHVSATPLGAVVRCRVSLTGIDRKRLTFSVEVSDEAGLIGKGTHERFIVDALKFQQKADGKFSKDRA